MSVIINNQSIIPVYPRKGVGKSLAKKLRSEGLIPGIVYGGKQEPVEISVKVKELFPHLQFKQKNFKLKFEDEREIEAVLREVQYDPLKDRLLHVDFVRV